MTMRSFGGTCLGLMLLASTTALAYAPDDGLTQYDVPLPEYRLIETPRAHFAVQDAEVEVAGRYGGAWHARQWNQFSRSPETIFGAGVERTGGALMDDSRAKTEARAFVAENAGALAIDNMEQLATARVVRGLGKVAVHFTQEFYGVPVHGGVVKSLSTETGRHYAMGATFYKDINVSPVPVISATQARGIAEAALPVEIDQAPAAQPTLLILPVPEPEGGADYHLVWRTTVHGTNPFGAWVTHVDAHSGEIVWRYNDVHSYEGVSQGDIDNTTYCDGTSVLPFRGMDINISGAGSTVTLPDGSFSLAGSSSATLTAEFDGPEQQIANQGGANASLSMPVDGAPITVDWSDSNSHIAERNTFYWVNETDAFVKGIDGTYDHPKYTCNVNINASCNANWNGNVMNFFRESAQCANTSQIGDVMAHEFGHGVQSDLIGSQGSQGLGEGNSDVLGSNLVDDSIIGRGFYLGDCVNGIRDCDNTLQWPDDANGQIHHDGQIICGFNWVFRTELEASMGGAAGKARAAEVWHFARKLWTPTTQTAQVDAYYLADDDDGNLDNGTPNFDALTVACEAHYEPPGLEDFCPEVLTGVLIAHSPLPNTTDHNNNYIVNADFVSTDGTVTVATMFYRVDGSAYTEVAMTPTGGDSYQGAIPAQADDAFVEYYLYGEDDAANTRTSPTGGATSPYAFFVATVIDELEAASGWTIGESGDDATTGIWELVDPIGTEAQPEDDHTPAPGTMAFVTGQCSGVNCPTCTLGCNDVDGGTTTLLSPVWDLSAATDRADVSYYRWYSNATGAAPNADNWVVDVSNDGGSTWTSVENVNPPNGDQARWVRVDLDLIAVFGTPNQVQLRFKASDLGSGSVVEAAVDDVVILTGGATTAVQSPNATPGAVRFAVDEARPNPFNPSTTVAYSVPNDGPVLVAIFDSAGRQIRTLVDGVVEAGAYEMQWDGQDDRGAAMASGVYHLKVVAGEREAARKLVLLK